jgi:hypothetical protein
VDSCLFLKDELVAASLRALPSAPTAAPDELPNSAPRVLFAIDDYSALHWRTEYGRADEDGRRVPLEVDDLSLVGLREEGGGRGRAREAARVRGRDSYMRRRR